jgi:hypothetical protein
MTPFATQELQNTSTNAGNANGDHVVHSVQGFETNV